MYKGSLLLGFGRISHFPKPIFQLCSSEIERGDMHMRTGRSAQRVFAKMDFFMDFPPHRFRIMETSTLMMSKNRISLTTVKSAAASDVGIKRKSHAPTWTTTRRAFLTR